MRIDEAKLHVAVKEFEPAARKYLDPLGNLKPKYRASWWQLYLWGYKGQSQPSWFRYVPVALLEWYARRQIQREANVRARVGEVQ